MSVAGDGGAGTPKALPSSGPKSLQDIPHPLAVASSSEELSVELTPSPDLQLPRSIADKVSGEERLSEGLPGGLLREGAGACEGGEARPAGCVCILWWRGAPSDANIEGRGGFSYLSLEPKWWESSSWRASWSCPPRGSLFVERRGAHVSVQIGSFLFAGLLV